MFASRKPANDNGPPVNPNRYSARRAEALRAWVRSGREPEGRTE